MSQPLSSESRRVLEQLRSASVPSAADRARGWGALQAQLPAHLGQLGPTPTAPTAGTKLALLGKWGLVALVSLTGTGAGVHWLGPSHSGPALASVPRVAPAQAVAQRETPTDPAAPPAPLNTNVAPQSAPRPPPQFAPPVHRPSLEEEIELLHRARLALQAGASAQAGRELNEHARLYPHSQLQATRWLLRVKVWCAQGNVDQARREARALRVHAPDSSEVTGLSGTCAADE